MPTETIGENTGDDYTGCLGTRMVQDVPDGNASGRGTFAVELLSAVNRNALIFLGGLSNISSGASVSDASLFLYQTSYGSTNQEVTLKRCLRAAVNAQFTWNIYSTGNSWTTAGGLSDGNDRSATISYQAVVSSGTGSYKEFTSAQMITDVDTDVGVGDLIWHAQRTASDSDGAFRFRSDTGTDGQRPYLSVTYTEGGDDLTATDGFEFSDSAGFSATAAMGLTDGFQLSDSAALVASGNMALADTAILSDSFSGAVSALMGLSDGFDLSDSAVLKALAGLAASDGFKFSDSESSAVSALMGLSDGFEFADTAQNTAALLMSLSDSAVFSDSVSIQSGNFMNLTDGFELSDSATLGALARLALSDGFEFSDSAVLRALARLALSDTAVFSDSLSLSTSIISLTLNDGFTFSDAVGQISAAVLGLEDGFVLSDTSSLSTAELVEGPVTISVIVKQSKFDIVVKQPEFVTLTKQPKFDIEVN